MKTIHSVAVALAALVLGAGPAAAQYSWGRAAFPRTGACFYEDIDFGGRYFCVPVGEEQGRVPRGTNDEISSIRLFGFTEVTVFRSDNWRGDSRRFTTSIRDLREASFNDRISSFVVMPRGSGGYGSGNWGGAYGGGNYGGGNYGRPPSNYGGGYNGGYGNNHGGWGGAYGAGSYGSSHQNGGRYTYEQAEAMVRQAYRRVLKRDPDPAARPWINEVIKNSWSQRQLEDALRDTPEGRSQGF